MFAFTTTPRGWLACRADFANDPVLNIDFIDHARDEIPFHLSLRPAEGVAVVNRRHAGGWRREIVWPFDYTKLPLTVELHFGATGVTLHLGGRRMGRFDALPRPSRAGRFLMRAGFPGLKRISRVRIEGGIEPGSLKMHRAVPSRTGPQLLTDRLELEMTVPADTEARAVALQVVPQAAPPATAPGGASASDSPAPPPTKPLATLHAVPRAGQLLMVVPGWLWAGHGAALRISARRDDGRALGAVTITRAETLSALERAALNRIWDWDALAVLGAIEHVHHAGLLDAMSEPARAALLAAAGRYRLRDWLLETRPAGAQATRAVPDTAPEADPVEAARLTVLRGLRGQQADPVALLADALANGGLNHERKQALVRVLVEPFCEIDRMDDLARLARDAGLLPLPDGDSAWDHSTALPFDLTQGWFDAIRGRLDYLGAIARRPGWAVTPAIDWTVRALVDFRPSLDGQRPTVVEQRDGLRAFLHYLDGLQGVYWSRSPCRALMGAMVHVLSRPELMRPDSLLRCVRSAIELWGLSPGFWAQIRAAGLDPATLPGRLPEVDEICTALQNAALAPRRDAELIDRLLCRAEALGIADAARFRRDLLGPSCLPAAQADPEALRRRGLDADDICLRALVHPDAFAGSDQTPAPQREARRQAARQALVASYVQLPSSQLLARERDAMQRARHLTRHPDNAALQVWARDLEPLSGPDQAHAGINLALGVAAALARAGQRDAAASLLAQPLLTDAAAARCSESGYIGPAQALAVLGRHDPDLAAQAGAALGLEPARIRAEGPADALALAANPLHDTLVAVYSCRANLNSRIAELRQGWLQDLTGMGIPWLVFTGDGDGRRAGDIVHLDAPDDYEGLPDKTLAMVRWVLENSQVSRLLKIDDDCFLHAEAWFGDLAHLRHDYYGRALTLMPGQMNRSWHMAKSRTPRGRLGLDKSPEPSRYADGGSGYMLSRHAMARLIDAADSPEGLQLRQLSYMEDKQTGDLLALRDIKVANEDYRTAVLRRTGPGGPLVPAWENGVLPFRGSPVKLVHLDDSLHQQRTRELSRRDVPLPGKIWPSYQTALSGSRSNTLDLLSPPARLAQVRRAPVAVVACLRNEAAMLPAFLDHYRRLGVEGFLIADNGSDDGTLELLAQSPDVALFAVDTEYNRSEYGVAWQQALLSGFRVGQWSLMADADEFLTWSDDPAARLPDLLAGPAFAGADAARVLMLDMYPAGPLSAVTLSSGDPFAETGWCEREPFRRVSTARGPFSDAETVTSALRHRLIQGSRPELFVAQKVALLRYQPWMRLSAGLHYVAETQMAPHDLLFAHFKYTAAFHRKVRAEVQRGQHFNDAEEYRKYLALLAEGQELIFDPETSVPWQDCAEVQRIFAAHRVSPRDHALSG